jgi:hypothetical protein
LTKKRIWDSTQSGTNAKTDYPTTFTLSMITITVSINEHTATRLKELVKDGYAILNQQGRQQRGVDGYTLTDLQELEKALNAFSPQSAQFGGGGNLTLWQ